MSDADATLSWDEFRRRAAEGSLTPEAVERHVEVDPDGVGPFSQHLRYTPSPGGGAASVGSNDIAGALAEYRDRIAPTIARRSPPGSFWGGAGRIKVAAEGDSWFNLPPVIWPADIVDVLEEDFEVKPVGFWGDKLEEMVHASVPQYRQVLGSGLYRHFLLSGGGNDVLGAIPAYVAPRQAGDGDPRNAARYVSPRFGQRVSQLIALFDEVSDAIARIPGVTIVMYVHGYADAVPRRGGPYLGQALAAKGFDPGSVGPLAAAIVARMVDIFNDALRGFAASRPNVVYLDLRPHMGPADWYDDEIHPKGEAARRLAGVFAQAIRRNEARFRVS